MTQRRISAAPEPRPFRNAPSLTGTCARVGARNVRLCNNKRPGWPTFPTGRGEAASTIKPINLSVSAGTPCWGMGGGGRNPKCSW